MFYSDPPIQDLIPFSIHFAPAAFSRCPPNWKRIAESSFAA
jgi:hypothetical protein